MSKPQVIVLSPLDSDECTWMSNGWNRQEISHLPESRAMVTQVRKIIHEASSVSEVITNLSAAGFAVLHQPTRGAK
jgi:lipopolysaccharide biosynthesis protein